MTDPRSLFDFEATTMYRPERAAEALAEHPALYVNHLTIAAHLERWADRLGTGGGVDHRAGFIDALQDVAAHLRQADYVPGSAEWESLVNKE